MLILKKWSELYPSDFFHFYFVFGRICWEMLAKIFHIPPTTKTFVIIKESFNISLQNKKYKSYHY